MIAHDHTSAIDYYRSVFLNSAHNLRVIVTDMAALYEMLDCSDSYCYGFATEAMYRNFPRQYKARALDIRRTGKSPAVAMAWIAPANMEFMPLVGEFVDLVVDACTCPDFWEKHPELEKPTD